MVGRFLLILISQVCLAQKPYLMVLGIAQDAGFPQVACQKSCCAEVRSGKKKAAMVSCLAVVDPQTNQKFIFDATPDFTRQFNLLQDISKTNNENLSILITHAHIGHYSGLMYVGREALNAKNLPVYAMPRMKNFLENHGPWSQLVQLNNIKLVQLNDQETIRLSPQIQIRPFLVPHRDEFSETVGYQIITPDSKIIFIPDIDKWELWQKDLIDLVKENDLLFLDATFFKDGEINRPMAEVPHPFVSESIEKLKNLPLKEKNKVYFIHFNHTNPLLQKNASEKKNLKKMGFNVALEGHILKL